MSRRYPSQEYHPCRQHKPPPTWEDEQDHQWLDQATAHYWLAEHLQGQVAVYRQQVAWLEREARREERQANQLVYQVGKGWARALEHCPPEHRHRKERSQAEVAVAAAAEEAAVVEAVVVAEACQACQCHHQADKQWCKEPQLQVCFQLPIER